MPSAPVPGLSPAQAQAANPAFSAWIAANAGSGKTRVLTARVARLLLQGVEPGQILCLTFTRAAAGEMKTRLFSILGSWAMHDNETLARELDGLLEQDEPRHDPADSVRLDHARRLFARALEYPGGLQIQTIHSFGMLLLRRFPLEAGLRPGLRVLDERVAAELAQRAFEETIRRGHADSGALGQACAVLMEVAPTALLTEFRQTIDQNRADYRALAKRVGVAGIAQAVQAFTGTDGQSAEECVRDTLGTPEDLRRLAEPLLEAIRQCDGSNDRKSAERITAGLRALEQGDPLLALSALLQGYLTQKGTRRVGLPGKEAREWLARNDAAEVVACAQERVETAEDARKRAVVAAGSVAAARFANAYLDALEAARHLAGGIDYEEIVEATHALLTRSDMQDWVRYRLDGTIRHILVDEAQDTSPAQWGAIQRVAEDFFSGEGAVAEPRTLFAVGDEKQSIFSFQGADPEIFGQTREWLWNTNPGQNALVEGQLKTSYRCAPSVLEFVDRVFSRESYLGDGVEPSEENFTEAEEWAGTLLGWQQPLSHAAREDGLPGRVEVWDLIQARPEDGDLTDATSVPVEDPAASHELQMAQVIARRIASWLKEGTVLPSTGRPVQPGDIMILVQRRKRLAAELIRLLRLEGVRVGGADRIILRESLVVMDMLALAEFALLPEDDHALAVVLRSPFCSISEEELFDLAWGRERVSLWHRLKQAADRDPGRFGEMRNLLESAIRDASRSGPFAFLERVLVRHDGRKKLLARLGPDAIEPLDALLDEALAFEDGTRASLQEFVVSVRGGSTEIKAGSEDRLSGVRILTIHGAKGLEAPIVIVPDTVRVPIFAARTRVFAAQGPNKEPVPLFVPRKQDDIPETRVLREQAQQREREESYRLFYVALTRAQEWLIVCGSHGKQSPSNRCWYYRASNAAQALGVRMEGGDSLLQARLGTVFPGWLLERGQAVEVARDTEAHTCAEPTLPDWAFRAAPRVDRPTRLTPSGLSGEAKAGRAGRLASGEEIRGSRAEEVFEPSFALNRGSLVHLLLERLADQPPGTERTELGRRLARHFGDELGEAEQEEVLARAEAILGDPQFAWIFAPDGIAELRIAVPVPDQNAILDGRIDRLVFDRERIVAVDFKSDALPPDRPEEAGKRYLAQLGAYRRALQTIWPGQEIAVAFFWTGGPKPRLMEVPAALADRSFADAGSARPGRAG